MPVTANFFQTNISPLVNARDERRLLRAIAPTSGNVMPADFQVGVVGAGTTLAVNVGPCVQGGGLIVPGQDTHQGSYYVYSDAAVQLPIAAADPTNPRIDTVAVRIFDDELVPGAGFSVQVAVFAGVPAAAPVAPALPRDCLPLADVRVNVGQTGVAAGNITDRRRGVGGRPWNVPWGVVPNGEALMTAGQNLAAATYDIAGLSVAFTALAGRLYRAYCQISQHSFNAAGTANWLITDAANAIKGQILYGGANVVVAQYSANFRTPSLNYGAGGPQTLKVRCISGSTDLRITGSAAQPNILTVEDIGPAPGSSPS